MTEKMYIEGNIVNAFHILEEMGFLISGKTAGKHCLDTYQHVGRGVCIKSHYKISHGGPFFMLWLGDWSNITLTADAEAVPEEALLGLKKGLVRFFGGRLEYFDKNDGKLKLYRSKKEMDTEDLNKTIAYLLDSTQIAS